MLLPISALSQRLKDNAPSLIGMLVLIALSVSLAWQSAELLRLVRGPVEQPPSQATPGLEQRAQAPIAQLFGTPRQADSGPPPATNLQLTLLGSFVHSDPQRSSAMIQRQGQSPQRYAIGTDVDNGVRLDAVYADRVELVRNGRRESLTFPRSQSGQYSYTPPVEAATEDPLQQFDQLGQDNLEQLRQRMQALREQMEASGTLPVETPSDQPMESD
ncbi:type II secretion system protein N [Pseudomonas berkeleyensis]|uniref:type II secretion system protein N n=1 Tax=Pseudomonas berkeleyensis TaxID=2726956 RepID=UPI001EE346E7|nr:type II secretion system protein N [Pseudomonas berkeleyensis]WSO40718.1 type II secretion system protein N [Pseudomonas berkeleyensis]